MFRITVTTIEQTRKYKNVRVILLEKLRVVTLNKMKKIIKNKILKEDFGLHYFQTIAP